MNKSTKHALGEGHLSELLEDVVFVDYFNTFLNLPVFGQTPLFLHSDDAWLMCPPIRGRKVTKEGFVSWMTEHRLNLFKQTQLFHFYCFCEDLLGFSKRNSDGSWSAEDQWLLRRVLGSVRGMRRFREFLQDNDGEDLLEFCVRVSRLLQLVPVQSSERHRYQAVLSTVRELLLRQGSRVLAVCHVPPDPRLRRQLDSGRPALLRQMKTRALHRLQAYWLPLFLRFSKATVYRLDECRHIAQQHRAMATRSAVEATADLTTVTSVTTDETKKPGSRRSSSSCYSSSFSSSSSSSNIYCSKSTKKKLWTQACPDPNSAPRGQAKCCQWLRLEDGAEEDPGRSINIAHHHTSHKEHSAQGALWTQEAGDQHVCLATPACFVPCVLPLPSLPPALPPYVLPALSADGLAGAPFQSYLRRKGLTVQLHQMALWEDLELFLCLLMRPQAHGGESLLPRRQALARRITDLYLAEDTPPALAEDTPAHLCLETDTWRTLRELLGCSERVLPWIHRARHQLGLALLRPYEDFLDEEDNIFSSYVCVEDSLDVLLLPPSGLNTEEQQLRRTNQALALGQACCRHGDQSEPPSNHNWLLLGDEDLGRGGSIHQLYRKTDPYDLPFPALAARYPRVAVERLSEDYRLFCQRHPQDQSHSLKDQSHSLKDQSHSLKERMSMLEMEEGEEDEEVEDGGENKDVEDGGEEHEEVDEGVEDGGGDQLSTLPVQVKETQSDIIQTPSLRPRSLVEVLNTPPSLESFQHFLHSHNAHGALLFIQEVELLRAIKRPKARRAKINAIMEHFFLRENPMDYLQCSDDIISTIPQMGHVTCDVLYTVQNLVSKSLEATWFREFQNTFPSDAKLVEHLDLKSDTKGVLLQNKRGNVWKVFTRFIKTVGKFLQVIRDPDERTTFEQYLRQSYQHYSEECPTPGVGVPLREDGDSYPMKKRLVNNRKVLVELLVNDLSFYREYERFRSLVEAGALLTSAGVYPEADHENMLYQKADMIIKLFLKSELTPKLRINISVIQRDYILKMFYCRKMDRKLFFSAVMSVFPTLIFCYKRFCHYKVIMKLSEGNALRTSSSEIKPLLRSGVYSNVYNSIQTIVSSTDEHPTLRFSMLNGLKLFVPHIKHELKGVSEKQPVKVGSRHRSQSTHTLIGLESRRQRGTLPPTQCTFSSSAPQISVGGQFTKRH